MVQQNIEMAPAVRDTTESVDDKVLDSTHFEKTDRERGTHGMTVDQILDEGGHVDPEQVKALEAQLAASRQEGYRPITEEDKIMNKRMNRKFDIWIIPICAVCFMFNQLDRSNLGNAEADGMSTDLGIPPATINTATSLFFATYVPLQPLGAYMVRRLGVIYPLGGLCFAWGLVTIGQAFVQTRAQLIGVRMLLGVTESGFYPGVLAYFANFYPRYDLAFRFAMFYGFFSIAGAFGGLIAYGVFQINGKLHGWQYLFLVEGAVPIMLGIVIPFWLPKGPENAWFLKPEEREFAVKRMRIDASANGAANVRITRRDFIETMKEWRLWVMTIGGLAAGLSPNGFSVFSPVVIKSLGYSGAIASLLTVPPYILGALVLWAIAWSSDHFRERTWHMLGGQAIVIIGFAITAAAPLSNIGQRYAGILIILSGAFVFAPLNAAWLLGNTPEPGKRALMIGFNGWINLSGIVGSELFKPQFAPSYHVPIHITIGLLLFAWFLFLGVSIALRLVNRSRAKKIAQMTPEEIEEENMSDVRVGDKKLTFVYGL